MLQIFCTRLYVPEPENDINTLTPEEFKKVLAACPDLRCAGIVTVGYYAGLRQKEIALLEWSDVDYDSGLLHIKNSEHHVTKSRKVRLVPMSAEVIAVLKELEVNRFSPTFSLGW